MAEIEFGAVDLLVREPAAEAAGALILNHGRGADERDLHGLLDALDPDRRLLGVTTGGPLRLPPGGRHWYAVQRVGYPEPQTFSGGYERLAARIDGLLEERGIIWGRTVVGGFSQGAVMSYSLALGEGRPVPAGLVALSGFVPEVEGWRLDPEGRAELPVLIHHGKLDPVISVGFGRDASQKLESAGLSPRYIETDAGHWVPPEIVSDLAGFVAAVTR